MEKEKYHDNLDVIRSVAHYVGAWIMDKIWPDGSIDFEIETHHQQTLDEYLTQREIDRVFEEEYGEPER